MEIQTLNHYLKENHYKEDFVDAIENEKRRRVIYRNDGKVSKVIRIARNVVPQGKFPEKMDAVYNGNGKFELVDRGVPFELLPIQLRELRYSFFEAKALELLDGTKFIVPLKNYILAVDNHGSLYSILETSYIHGRQLEELALEQNADDRLSMVEGVKALADVAGALYDIHRHNIVHRDINPRNVLFSRDRQEAMVLDFGIAHYFPFLFFKDGVYTDLELLLEEQPDMDADFDFHLGSYSYMSPEQVRFLLTPKTDVFALGLVGYKLFTGEKAFPYPKDAEQQAQYVLGLANYIEDGNSRWKKIIDDLVTLSEKRFSQKLPDSIVQGIEQALHPNAQGRSLFPLEEAANEYLAEFMDTRVIWNRLDESPVEDEPLFLAENVEDTEDIHTNDIEEERPVASL